MMVHVFVTFQVIWFDNFDGSTQDFIITPLLVQSCAKPSIFGCALLIFSYCGKLCCPYLMCQLYDSLIARFAFVSFICWHYDDGNAFSITGPF